MGGNAIKNARRLDKDDYFAMVEEVSEILKPYAKFDIVKAYREKQSFGDMDIVVQKPKHGWVDWNEILTQSFNSKEIVHNGPVISFEYKGFQIDLISTPVEHYDFAVNYYSYNDICNLIGRITHKMGIKFGHDGLWYILRDGDTKIADLLITTDFKKALEAFDFSYERFVEGFDNLEDIFNYVSTNKYFNPDIYLLENRNHTARVRDKKRKTYTSFLEWCAEHNWANVYQFESDKNVYLPMMFSKFVKFKIAYSHAIHDHKRHLEAKAKFPTSFVQQHTGLTGKELGAFMSYTTSAFEDKRDWYAHILVLDKWDLMADMFDNALQHYKADTPFANRYAVFTAAYEARSK